ncbi:HlyD family efflux transporter periplasmic adaptor subunit [Amphritea sp. 1_MG-2023]|uniref:efflux RND transporter periplasmic adaptor subunit n=1 Tax=Amphritea sp. 1_MG-2023 TaxID=3062670 RepID=UPI0026E33726|nr:HlyD family efflux transporter periplasmic adaptor subunit [Amphritea sp. 1_MG-2023]MDO6563307.1 HlyD family efflux transporter periplasmic adaptor subunit [Amphritea sp. 1_MG-2023]
MLNDWLKTVCLMLSKVKLAAVFDVSKGMPDMLCCWPQDQGGAVSPLVAQVDLAITSDNPVISYLSIDEGVCVITKKFTGPDDQTFVVLICFPDSGVSPKYQLSLIDWSLVWYRLLVKNAHSDPVASSASIASDAKASERTPILLWIGDKLRAFRVSLLIALCFLMLCLFLPVDHSIKPPVVVEGRIQRSITIPVDGVIKTIDVQAGDIINAGQLIASLDDAEIRLQLDQLKNDVAVAEKQHRQALAQLKYAEAQQFSLQGDIANIDMQLLQQKLSRLALRAPITGQIISGDMGRAMGSVVKQGQVLFEMAPVGQYRIVFEVDEADIRYVSKGNTGEILLTGLGNRAYPVVLDTVSSVFTAQPGQRFYRVEGHIEGDISKDIRPGMKGVADLIVGRKRLGEILFGPLMHWLRLKSWQWLP